jgi:hypothetical protein
MAQYNSINIEEVLKGGMGLQLVTPILNYINHDKKRFKELIYFFDKGDYTLQHHASYVLTHLAQKQTELLPPYTNLLLNVLQREGIHESTKRNTMRCFQEFDCDEKYAGELLEVCYRIMKNATLAPATIAFAINVAAPLCKRYPDLIPELLLVLKELHIFHTAPSITAAVKKAQKMLTKPIRSKK